MWTDIKKKKPTHDGPYTVFGTVNNGTEHETNSRFTAYWCEQSKSFTDKDGEDLTGINDGVKFWFDFSKVPDPVVDDVNNHKIKKFDKVRMIKTIAPFRLGEELRVVQVDKKREIPYLCTQIKGTYSSWLCEDEIEKINK